MVIVVGSDAKKQFLDVETLLTIMKIQCLCYPMIMP